MYFEILKSKRVSFSSDTECEDDEKIYIQEAFKTKEDLTSTENKIIELIKKDKRITPEVISNAIGETVAFVNSKIANLVKRGIIEQAVKKEGVDQLIERTIVNNIDLIPPPIKPGTTNPTRIFIKYSYEGPQDSRNRPFCAKLMELHRLYSRAEIENISARLGYSVFDRRGGFWTRKGTHDTTPYCRHNWKSNLLVKK
jgi:DNA-binding Lrp family transcriptional regulator